MIRCSRRSTRAAERLRRIPERFSGSNIFGRGSGELRRGSVDLGGASGRSHSSVCTLGGRVCAFRRSVSRCPREGLRDRREGPAPSPVRVRATGPRVCGRTKAARATADRVSRPAETTSCTSGEGLRDRRRRNRARVVEDTCRDRPLAQSATRVRARALELKSRQAAARRRHRMLGSGGVRQPSATDVAIDAARALDAW